jgi:Zn-dependent protease
MQGIEISPKLISFFTFLPLFFLSISVHELAHALLAYKFGDNTAKDLGRLTLNPLKHIDIVGTILMPLASFATGFALIGWAKPVPVNPSKFGNRRRDGAIVSFAGPFSNFLLSFLFMIILFVLVRELPGEEFLINAVYYGMFFNIFLGLFNLLPIPPLDGSHILFDIFPNKFTASMLKVGFYGSFILLIFIYSPLWGIFMNFVNLIVDFFINVVRP